MIIINDLITFNIDISNIRTKFKIEFCEDESFYTWFYSYYFPNYNDAKTSL